MFRDFHLVEGAAEDWLFFPESVKFYTVPKEEAAAIRDYLAGGEVPPLIVPLLEAEATAAQSAGEVQRRRATAARPADSLCLYMAHECNLACTYCYNDGGRAAGVHPVMAPGVIDAAMRRWFTAEGRTYAVSFYGGEPLLNFAGMQSAVTLGEALEKERGIRIIYGMTTNGTVLTDAMVRFIDRHVGSVTVSLDGPEVVNDRHRRWQGRAEGRGTYARVIANLRRLKHETRARVTLKATLAGDVLDDYEHSLEHLRALGADGVLMTPVATDSANAAAMDDARHAEFVRRQVEQNRGFFRPDGRGDEGDGSAIDLVANLLTKRKFTKHCDAGANPAVAADGSIYACHGLVGSDEFRMGSVGDDGTAEARQRDRFRELNVCALEECRRCWARYLCGGACYAHAWQNTGSVGRPDPRHCRMAKANAEMVIREFMQTMAVPSLRARLYARVKAMVDPQRSAAHG